MRQVFISILWLVSLSACAATQAPKTLAERSTSYSYIPLDPLPIARRLGDSCEIQTDNKTNLKPLLEALPDQAVRIAVGTYDASGTLVFGPAKIGVKGQSYQVVLDYVSVDATNVPVYIERWFYDDKGTRKEASVFDESVVHKTQYRVHRDPKTEDFISGKEAPSIASLPGDRVVIPVYVGVGLRLTASVTVTKGEANLSSLGAIAAEAQAGKLTGSLVVQTLGVTGKTVATTLPLPSELNSTTISNAILALGAIKAVLYDPNTHITPRVVGIYNPVGGGQQIVNGIISILANERIPWHQPCVPPGSGN
ncbi:hypothetical protein [Archangium sp. Cb G35]|uniref:hypothetical protein n=1 Tax=Archangium sp. Cb G35 TaxID=1920190 RepID=UPI0009367C63|nr:hypothetical protein [Archangium sp. Cb G35]